MNTPIYDFVTRYLQSGASRFHMPGHKGRGALGCEDRDLTEIPGADSLYEAAGIIAESEKNASALFGCPTYYSTEGSSQCIRAMLLLALQAGPMRAVEDAGPYGMGGCFGPPRASAPTPLITNHRSLIPVLAARNVHRSFLTAAALLDADVVWLDTPGQSYLSADVTPETLDRALRTTPAAAVYLTCPDYLGTLPDLRPLADVCHAHGALLLVDNAHGAYLRFLTPSRHPIDLGADLCCDSAHKTLPALTGAAYLHVRVGADAPGGPLPERSVAAHIVRHPAPSPTVNCRAALAMFGSTSPSYLILQSLDLCNPYLETLRARLNAFLPRLDALRAALTAHGWTLCGDEPMKLTLRPKPFGWTGTALAAALAGEGLTCEFADPDFLVLMPTPENSPAELDRLQAALCALPRRPAVETAPPPLGPGEKVCTLREAMLAPAHTIPVSTALGRVLAAPTAACPPAVPIRMPGERIDDQALAAFAYYGIETVTVMDS